MSWNSFDDSKLSASIVRAEKRGQARYSDALPVIFHFILSIRYKVSSLLFIEKQNLIKL